MNGEDLRFLMEEAAPWFVRSEKDFADPLAWGTRLRKDLPKEQARLVVEQDDLRRRALAKFGASSQKMFFTKRLLEQATGGRIGRYKANRFMALGCQSMADLCCGLGGDAIAMAEAGLEMHLVDLDPIALRLARHNLAAAGFAPRSWLECQLPDLPEEFHADGFHLDPDRRTKGREEGEERWDHGGLSPDLEGIRSLCRRFPMGVVKLSPGTPHGVLDIPCETEYLGVADELREQAVWVGEAAKPGWIRATEFRGEEMVSYTASEEEAKEAFEDEPVEPGAYIWEPVKALVRSHLFAAYGRTLGLHPLDRDIAWRTGQNPVSSLLLKGYKVLAHAPLKAGAEEDLFRQTGRSCQVVKKRGVAVVPEAAVRKLRALQGDPATLIYTRVGGRKWVLVVEPLADSALP